MQKGKLLNNAVHAGLLKKLYPQGKVISVSPRLLWECEFQPTPLSCSYTIRVCYQPGKSPTVNVIGTTLDRGECKTLPHVYSSDEQDLCLHYPPERKWTADKNIADTIVPWAAEWLYHYEIWVLTGCWNGGGNVH